MNTAATSRLGLQGALLALTAVALQVLTTFPIGTLGVRVSAADILLPWLLAMLIIPALRQHRNGAKPPILFWILVLWTAWLAVSIVIGRLELGRWHSWAVINRGAGWFVLLGFLAAGWLLVRQNMSLFENMVLRILLIGTWCSVLFSALLMILIRFQIAGIAAIRDYEADAWQQMLGLVTGSSRFQGFFVNPNAFAFFLTTVICFHLPLMKSDRLFPRGVHTLGLAISLFGLFFTYSRGAWLGILVAIAFLLLLRQADIRALIVALIIAGAASLILMTAITSFDVDPAISGRGPAAALDAALTEYSIDRRWLHFRRALELWWQHPFLGIGMATFIGTQAAVTTDMALHSTYLWLLTETGIVGLAIGILFIGMSFFVLLRAARRDEGNYLSAGAAAMLLCGAIVALAMEALYQRHLWLLLGAGIAAASRPSLATRT